MKACDEMISDLLERRELYARAQKQKKRCMTRFGLAVSVVCCAVMVGFGLWQRGAADTTPPVDVSDAVIPGVPDYVDPVEEATNPAENDPARIVWVLNTVDGLVSGSKLHFDTDTHYSISMSDDALQAYYGRDLSALGEFLPDGYVYKKGIQPTFHYKNDGTLVYDISGYSYENGDVSVRVWVSKLGAPYDYVYQLDSPTYSEVNGVDVLFGGVLKQEDSERYGLLFADFTCDGLEYRVTVEDHSNMGLDSDVNTWFFNFICQLTE